MISVLHSAIIIFAITITCGMLPLCFKVITRQKMIIALANSFSAGLFISIALFHILPEAEMDFSNGMKWKKLNQDFPYCQLIMVIVYLFILYLEKIRFAHTHNFEIEIQDKIDVQNFNENKFFNEGQENPQNVEAKNEDDKDISIEKEDLEEKAGEIFKNFVSRRNLVM